MTTLDRLDWSSIVAHGADIVRSYDTGVTLRQLFYRLVADGTLPNSLTAYKGLSRETARARRMGAFPALIDRTRSIYRDMSFSGPREAREWLGRIYRRDHDEGQIWSLYLGVEKHGLVEQLRSWFRALGIAVVPLGGYSSQTFVDEVRADVEEQARPAAFLYAGDYDPSGEDIDRDFVARADCFDEVRRIALTSEQVREYDLPPAMGKASDSRAASFVARHGRLVQVELDALPPDVLRTLFQQAIDDYWDMSMYEAVLRREARERKRL